LKTQGAASNPIWDTVTAGAASGLASPFTIEGGTNDPSTTVTAQTVGAAALTIPDLANVAQQWVFTKVAQTLENKTLTAPIIATGGKIVDAGGDEYLVFTEAATPVTYLEITSGNTGVAPELKGAGETNTSLKLSPSGTGTVQINDDRLTILTTNNVTVIFSNPAAGRNITFADPGGNDEVVYLAATQTLTNKTLTTPVIAQISNTGTLTLPTSTDTLVGRATTDTLTNKTFNCDGTGNDLQNVNADELDPVTIATGAYGISFIITAVNTGTATITIFNANAPFKFRVIDAWAVSTQAGNAGTWVVDNGTNNITSAISYGTADTDISRATDLDDAYHEIAANGTLRLISSNAADTAIVYILAMRVD
jgi:hypothetical protein